MIVKIIKHEEIENGECIRTEYYLKFYKNENEGTFESMKVLTVDEYIALERIMTSFEMHVTSKNK